MDVKERQNQMQRLLSKRMTHVAKREHRRNITLDALATELEKINNALSPKRKLTKKITVGKDQFLRFQTRNEQRIVTTGSSILTPRANAMAVQF